jgi:hypothetical protein
MASPSKKCPIDDDEDKQGTSSTPLPPAKKKKVDGDGHVDNDGSKDDRDDNADFDDNGDDESKPESALESRDDEPFTLDSEDRKLFKWHTHSNNGDTSSESVESVSYNTVDGGGSSNDDSDDDITDEFSDEEDW